MLALPVACAIGFSTAAAVRPQSAAAAPAVKPAEPVRVLREVPRVERPPQMPSFSSTPSAGEIRSARVFGEPIVALGAEPEGAENQALAKAVLQRLESKGAGGGDPVRAHLERFPDSPYRASLLLNLAMSDRRQGAFTRAIASLEEAWRLTKSLTDPDGRAIAERSIAELGDIHLRFGSMEGLEFVMAAIEGRNFSGASAQKLALAREGYSLLLHHHEDAIPSARTALQRYLRAAKGPDYAWSPRLDELRASHSGANLLQVRELSRQIGEPLRILRHDGGEIPVPSVVHLTSNHYSAIVREEKGRYLLDDPCLGGELWVTREVLLAESSGFFFVPESSNPAGFQEAVDQEAALHRGKCYPLVPDPDGPRPDEPEAGCNRQSPPVGLARWSINKLQASLHLSDLPVGYKPPRGPSIGFQLDYHHREKNQPAIFSYSNIGPLWGHRWLAYLEDDPSNAAAPVAHYQPGGGVERWFGYDAGTGSYAIDRESRAQLVRVSVSPIRYERRLPDGSVEVFEQPDGAATSPRRVFRTAVIDPQGNGLTYTYDASLRLVAVTDAIGQVTTLAYENADPLKITKVTDPFGRFAQLDYDASGRLVKITDVIGLESKFEYEGAGMIASLETPYGRTSFSTDPFDHSSDIDTNPRWVEVEDPLGGRERVEYRYHPAELASTDPIVPFGFDSRNVELDYRVTFYWDKRAMSLFPGDLSKAEVTKWLMAAIEGFTQHSPVAVPHNIKKPLENRVWYAYPNQTDLRRVGSHTLPSKIARVLDDGQTQVHSYEYDDRGNRTLAVDPLGRTTRYTYSADGTDLLQVHQLQQDGSYSLLQSFTYNSQRLPVSIADSAGQTTTYTYLFDGRRESIITPARDNLSLAERTTTFSYYADGDPISPRRLRSVTGPHVGGQTGPSTVFVYDIQGRLRSVTQNPDNYTVTTDYDSMGRPVKVTYPDGTYEETAYHRLDAVAFRDRLGRWSSTTFDPLRRPVATTDPMGNTLVQRWCDCGSLERLVDARGNVTTWERDLQGRVTRETWANGKFKSFVYESASSRLSAVTDPMNQTTAYEYDLDDNVVMITYLGAQVETPNVTFSYRLGGQPLSGAPDPYGRLTRRVDGIGTTNYTYHPTGILGATRLASVDGPFMDDTINYTYDEVGRVRSRSVGTGNTVEWDFDPVGRLLVETNFLGSFAFAYDNSTSRLVAVDYPNGLRASYAYHPPAADSRLQRIHNHVPSTLTTISAFEYTYDAVGNILTWQRQVDADPPTTYSFNYDRSDRMISADLASGESSILHRYRYVFDAAGNRIAEQVDDSVAESVYDTVNRLTLQRPGGRLLFRGTTDEPASVAVSDRPAVTTGGNDFMGPAEVGTGASSVEVAAVDTSGNLRVNTYEVTQSGDTTALTWDDNGNLVSDGTRIFEWDAENRLVAIESGAARSEFSYDGLGARSRVVEKVNGAVVSEVHSVWCGFDLCETRSPSDTILSRYFSGGVAASAGEILFSHDHLQSVRELTAEDGSVLARFDYTPFGQQSIVTGSLETDRGFTGHFSHGGGEIWLSFYRPLDSRLGRWISRDPIGLASGPNAYLYAEANPARYSDPLGLLVQLYCHLVGAGGGPWPSPFDMIGMFGYKHCFVRDKCACEGNEYDLVLEVTGRAWLSGRAEFEPEPRPFWQGDPHIERVAFYPPDNNSEECSMEDCILAEYERRKSSGQPYGSAKYGPNSNTFAAELLYSCGVEKIFWPAYVPPFTLP